jgi:hypothetical protein
MKEYDLEERTYEFAQGVREFVKRIPRSPENIEDVKLNKSRPGSSPALGAGQR